MNYYDNNPLREFENIAREIGKVFNEAQRPVHRQDAEDKPTFKPKADILEDNQKLYFQVELPGIKKEDVKLTISPENVLTISGKKDRNIGDEVNLCCRQERKFGNFMRSFALPENLDAEKVSAKFDSGVLYISIEKKIEVMPKENIVTIE